MKSQKDSRTPSLQTIQHLIFNVSPRTDRDHYYEQLWKEVGMLLLAKFETNLPDCTLLDYGCGRGETMAIAAKMGMQVTGTDVDELCNSLSAHHGEVTPLNAEDPLSQFGPKSYDYVCCFHVLEHVPSPVNTLRDLGLIARKGVILAVPNLSAFHDLLRPRKWLDPVNQGHLQSWDHAHLKNLAEQHCGLKIIEWGFDTTKIPPLSNLIVRLLGWKAAVKLETTLFKLLFPYASHSVIAYMTPIRPA